MIAIDLLPLAQTRQALQHPIEDAGPLRGIREESLIRLLPPSDLTLARPSRRKQRGFPCRRSGLPGEAIA
jgi:hypothetical protein